MIPSTSFQEKLRLYDPDLFVRWEYYKDEGDGKATCAPYAGPVIREMPELFPATGRFCLYSKDRAGLSYKVFDVAYPDGGYHPLDDRVLFAIKKRDSAWDIFEEDIEQTKAGKVRDARLRNETKVAGPMADGLEIAYRTGTGLRQFAPGAPGAPASVRKHNAGYTVTDRRRFLGD